MIMERRRLTFKDNDCLSNIFDLPAFLYQRVIFVNQYYCTWIILRLCTWKKNKQTNIPSMENIKHVYAKQTYSKPSIHELRPIPSSDRTNFMNIPLFHDSAKWVHPLPPLGIMPVKITKFLRRNSHAGENDMSTPVLLTTEFVSRCKIPFLHQRY